MRGPCHRAVGGAFGLMAMCWLDQGTPFALASGILAGCIGGTAPDWLELPYGENRRLITHRTWTHWLPFWVLALLTARAHWQELPMVGMPAMAFIWGALSHLLMDWPNPRGIPVLSPVSRHSLDWWPSGRHDGLLSIVAWAAALGWLWQVFNRS